MKRAQKILPLLATMPLIVSLACELHAQCAMCRTALTSSPEGQEMIAGFDSAILFLLAVPLVIFGTVLLLLWRAARKRSKARYEEGLEAEASRLASSRRTSPTNCSAS
jgi:heme/copper-type cytochrome/quinol oxidase subunit 2